MIEIYTRLCKFSNIYQENKNLFVAVQPEHGCKLESADHLWLPFPDQPQSGISFFVCIIYNILLKKTETRKRS